MSWTKRQFIESAFTEIGMAAYDYNRQPEQLTEAVKRLDAMMATWNANGTRIGYPISSNPDATDLDEDTKVQDAANEAIILNLAVRLAPAFGKTVSLDTKMNAKQSYVTLGNKFSTPLKREMPSGYPAGAGNRGREVLNSPVSEILTGGDGILDLG